ncbi:tetratricopeptide repeat protein, partial [Saprospiraceae bacterium]|nr:tetratricopeptide repeat protein [Saprospiraceae bacterium]
SPPIKTSYQRLCYTYGMQFLLDGNTTKSVEYFKKADTNPLDNTINALTYYRLANIDYDRGLHQQSISRLNQYFSLAKTGIQLPEDADLAYGNYLQAYNYLKLEDYTVARKYFEEASQKLKLQPARKKLTMDALLRTADCYFRINSYNSAIKYYNLAIDTRQKGGDYALYQRGILQGLLGKPFDKIVTMDELIEKHPSSPLVDFAIFQNGETLQAIGEATEAERSFRRIVDEFKKSTLRNRSLLKLGLIAFNQGNVQTSVSYYKELFNHNPSASESQEAIIALEEIYVETLSKPDEFFAFVEDQGGFKMSSFEKDSISFRSGDIQFENAEYEKAISAYSRYIKNYPQGFNRIVAHYRRAESFSLQKRFPEALNDYEYVVKQGVSKYYLKALEKGAIISYNSVDDYKKAFDYYSLLEEIELDPEKQYSYQMGALRSASRIDDKKAIRYMGERVLENNYLTQEDKSLAMFYLAKINYEEDKIEDALVQFQQVIALSDNVYTAEARYLAADIYYQKKDIAQAEAYSRLAIADSKPYPYWVAKSMILLSDVFVANKDLLQAKAALKAVIENFNSDEEMLKDAKMKLATVLQTEAEINRVDADTSKELQMDNSGNN